MTTFTTFVDNDGDEYEIKTHSTDDGSAHVDFHNQTDMYIPAIDIPAVIHALADAAGVPGTWIPDSELPELGEDGQPVNGYPKVPYEDADDSDHRAYYEAHAHLQLARARQLSLEDDEVEALRMFLSKHNDRPLPRDTARAAYEAGARAPKADS